MIAARSLSSLLDEAGCPVPRLALDPSVLGVTLDSRTAQPGELFVAVPGLLVSGERYATEAIRRGVRAIVARSERPADLPPDVAWVSVDDPRRLAGLLARAFWGRPDEGLRLVGITGTNGKTTVAWLVESIARAAGCGAGRLGTIGYRFGEREGTLARTTPEAPDLFRLLAEMRDAGAEIVAMEVSSHALELHRVAGARFAVAAFLNLGRDHLDFHRDTESYFAAKARLFDALRPDGVAVLPADDPWGSRLRARVAGRLLGWGRAKEAEVRIVREQSSLDGSTATLVTAEGSLELRTPLPGRFNLDNAVAAATCGLGLGIDRAAVTRGIAALERVPGRMERVGVGLPWSVLVDYAHTEAALEGLLRAAREGAPGRVLVVFGCGGQRDTGKRPGMGRIAASLADRIWLTSDNPRDEDPAAILDDVWDGIAAVPSGPERARRVPDRRQAIREAILEARPGDVVVVAGKGHETTQTAGGRTVPFDDRLVCEEALAERDPRGDGRGDA